MDGRPRLVTRQPNILLILTDQQRWDSLGCYGTPGVHTPNLDRLASDGIRYDRCYVNGTICTPSRASLWTGKHLPGHGVHSLHDCLSEEEVLFPKRLQQAGYETALFGKLHVSGHRREYDRRHPNDGFDTYEWASDPKGPWGMDNAYLQWLEERDPALREAIRNKDPIGHIPVESHMTTWAAERSISFLDERSEGSKPFFACMSVFDPHSPYTNHPEEMEGVLDQSRLPDVVAGDQPFEGRPIAHDMERRWGTQVPDAETLAQFRVGYHAAIANIDAQVGRVLDALKRNDLADSTVVIFTSDHGDMMGDHGLMTKGAYFYDACTRVPMIVRSPGSESRVESSPVQLHDIASTCLQLAGEQETEVWSPDGISLLDSECLAQRNRAVCLYRNSGNCTKRDEGYRGYFDPPIHGTMWFEEGHKVSVYHSPDPDPDHPEGEVYDLHSDPNETVNLWDLADKRLLRDEAMRKMLNWLAVEEVRGRGRGEDASDGSFAGR